MDSFGDSENEVVNLSLMAKNYESEEEDSLKKNCNNIKMIWVPKGSIVHTNTQGPNKNWVPKSQC